MYTSINNKVSPVIKEPLVWTPTAKERYETQQRQLSQKKTWDIIIQENFDWLFRKNDQLTLSNL